VGQAPLRAAWLRGATLAGLTADTVFSLDGDTLAAALSVAAGDRSAAARPRDERTPRPPPDDLVPAEVLWDQRAFPSPASAHARFSAGTSFEGRLRRRSDLDDLRRRPCAPTEVVLLPTLLPQAALLLHMQGIRVVVTAFGGASCHGARMAWELGLTALLGIGTRPDLRDGDAVRIDTASGRLLTHAAPRRD
jgi:hypothetical protein